MHVKQWFGRLDAHCSQLDEIRAALNDSEYNHPWCEPTLAAEIAVAGETVYGPGWKFDPTKHLSEHVRLKIHQVSPTLAVKMTEACEQLSKRNGLSWYQIANTVHGVYASTLDYNEGSLDSHLLEQSSDGHTNDGFALRRRMKEVTVLQKPTTGITINCDSELSKIQYEFIPDGIQQYFSCYRAQLALFREHNVDYTLPEAYHCDRILAHLRNVNVEFLRAATRCLEKIDDKQMDKSIDNLERIFRAAETNGGIGPDNHGTPVKHGAPVLLATRHPGAKPKKANKKQNDGKYPKGSCRIHVHSRTHLTKDCKVQQARDAFVCPFTGRKGLPDALVCPLCPTGAHPAELHNDPRYNPKLDTKRGPTFTPVSADRQRRYEQHLRNAQAMIARGSWAVVPPCAPGTAAPTPMVPPPSQHGIRITRPQTQSAPTLAPAQHQALCALQEIHGQLLGHAQALQQHPDPLPYIQKEPVMVAGATGRRKQFARIVHPEGDNARTLVQLGRELQHLRSSLNTQRL